MRQLYQIDDPMAEFTGYIATGVLALGAVFFLISLLYSRVKDKPISDVRWLKYMSFALLSMTISGLIFIHEVSYDNNLARYSLNSTTAAIFGLITLAALFYWAYQILSSKDP